MHYLKRASAKPPAAAETRYHSAPSKSPAASEALHWFPFSKKKSNRHTRTNFENLNLEFGPVRIEPCDRHGRRVCIKGRSSARLACPCRKAENLSNHHTDFDLIASAVFLWAWCDRPRPGLRHVPRCHEWQSLCIGNTIIWFLMDFIALPMHCSWAIFFARRILH